MRTAHACMSTRCLEIQPRTCCNDSQHLTEWLSSVHKQAHKQKAPCDLTAFVCVITKWVWQVVFLSAASVPHSDSLVEFLWELMVRSGRGTRTSAVWDLTEPIRLTSGQDRGKKEGMWGGAGDFFSNTRHLLTPVPVIWWQSQTEESKRGGSPVATLFMEGQELHSYV